MFFSSQDKGEMAAMCHNWPQDDVEAIVVTGGCRTPSALTSLSVKRQRCQHAASACLWRLALEATGVMLHVLTSPAM
jgi:hypothetical protein